MSQELLYLLIVASVVLAVGVGIEQAAARRLRIARKPRPASQASPWSERTPLALLCGVVVTAAALMAASFAVLILAIVTGTFAPHGADDTYAGAVLLAALALVVLALGLGVWTHRSVSAGTTPVPFLAAGSAVFVGMWLLWRNFL